MTVEREDLVEMLKQQFPFFEVRREAMPEMIDQ